jgi:hypothetical protein
VSIASLLTAKSSTEKAGIKAVALRDEWLSRVGSKAYVLVHPSDSSLRITVSDIMAPLRKSYPMLETRCFLERRVGKRWLYVPTDPHGHFRFGNPPIRVPDGTTATVTLEDGTQVEQKNYREDPLAAAQSMLWEAVLLLARQRKFATQEGGIPTGPFPANMTTDTFYGDTGDGAITSDDSATYSTVRAGNSLAASTSGTSGSCGQRKSTAPEFFCYELFLAFTTSSIPDTATLSAGTLSLYASLDQSATAEFVNELRLKDWSGGGLTTADWVAGADLGGLTLLATKDTTGGIATDAYTEFTSEAALLSNISLTGTNYYMLCSSLHRLGTEPSTGEQRVFWYLSDNAGTTNDPKLVVTYTVPAGWMGFGTMTGGLQNPFACDMTGGVS